MSLRPTGARYVRALAVAALIAPAAAPAVAPPGALEVTYEYSLSTTNGVVPFAGVRLNLDPQHAEVFVVADGRVRIFNQGGMEVFAFGDDGDLGFPSGVVALEDGDLLVLAHAGGAARLVRCDFRGAPVAPVALTGVPAAFAAGFLPDAIAAAAGNVFLADRAAMKVLVARPDGSFVNAFDVAALLDLAARRADFGLRGFNVDREGNVLFTIQPLFQAFLLSPTGELKRFGQRGSAPGKFNIVGGIARDDAGYVYVTDILKSAVLVFDPALRFVKEFGYRGSLPSSLAAPVDVAAAGGRVWVAQNARRGVSVFRVSVDPNGREEGGASRQ